MNTLTMVTIAVIVILITGLIIPLRMSIRSKLIISLLLIGGMCRNYIYLKNTETLLLDYYSYKPPFTFYNHRVIVALTFCPPPLKNT